MDITLRPCAPQDSEGWLRCRILSFLDTQYFDDVRTGHAVPSADVADPADSIQWVAETPSGQIVGILDVELGALGSDDEGLAAIDTVAVHPDHRGQGIGAELLECVVTALPPRIHTLDAWTREDLEANAWYRRGGFEPLDVYLHVYLDQAVDTPAALDGIAVPEGLSLPVKGFFHASLEQESEMRGRLARVHRCTRYVRSLSDRGRRCRGRPTPYADPMNRAAPTRPRGDHD